MYKLFEAIKSSEIFKPVDDQEEAKRKVSRRPRDAENDLQSAKDHVVSLQRMLARLDKRISNAQKEKEDTSSKLAKAISDVKEAERIVADIKSGKDIKTQREIKNDKAQEAQKYLVENQEAILNRVLAIIKSGKRKFTKVHPAQGVAEVVVDFGKDEFNGYTDYAKMYGHIMGRTVHGYQTNKEYHTDNGFEMNVYVNNPLLAGSGGIHRKYMLGRGDSKETSIEEITKAIAAFKNSKSDSFEAAMKEAGFMEKKNA